MHWNKHHIADRLACRLLRHWRTADNDQGVNLCYKMNLIAIDKRRALWIDFIELFIYVLIFSRTRSQWRWTPSSSSRSISMNQGRGAGVGYRTLRDRNFKKHVTITTITKMCSTLLLQLVAEVRHNCILSRQIISDKHKTSRCSIHWLRCATTRTTGTPLSPLLAPCSGFSESLFVKTSRFSQGPLPWHLISSMHF